MVWFKNARVYKVAEDFNFDQVFAPQVEIFSTFQPCGQQQEKTLGFIEALPGGDSLYYIDGDVVLMRIQEQTRIIPAQYVNKCVQARCEKIAANEDRSIGSKERQGIKDEVIFELRPKAFTKDSVYSVYFDRVNKRLVVDASSNKTSDDLVSFIRQCLGGLPCLLLQSYAVPPTTRIDALMRGNMNMPGFGYDYYAQFTGERSESRTIKGAVNSKEYINFSDGMKLAKSGMTYEDKFSFVVDSNYSISRLVFAEKLTEQVYASEDYETKTEQAAAAFIICYSAINELLNKLIELCGVYDGEGDSK
jgi:recombination associated protein RdgC